MLEDSPLVAFVGVADLAVARRFYGETLGLPLRDELPYALVGDAHGTTLRITAVPTPSRAPFTVLGWQVADLDATVDELIGRGVRFLRYEALDQDDRGLWEAPGGTRVAWFTDPDGNVLSVNDRAG
ncbi:MAG TPA: VOC family protein [Pseudonocardia sp.]